jgi:hypothetical protein
MSIYAGVLVKVLQRETIASTERYMTRKFLMGISSFDYGG